MTAGVNGLTERIIGLAISVHRELGPGLLESAYEECLVIALKEEGLAYERQGVIPVRFRGHEITPGFRFDLVVERQVIIEVKAVETVLKIHKAQVLTYLRMSGISVGLLLNFNTAVLRDGIHRLAIQTPLL